MASSLPVRSVHILSDRKFLPWIKRTFNRQGWICDFILINHFEKGIYRKLDDNTLEISFSAAGIQQVIRLLDQYDVAFHYLLEKFKAEVISNRKSPPLHFWCYYGAEVYQQTKLFRKTLYGPETNKWLKSHPKINYRFELRAWYYRFVKWTKSPFSALKSAIPHISGILWYVEDEMIMVNEKLKLPPWKNFQFFQFSDIIPNPEHHIHTGAKRILIGNSYTIENNHADTLPALQKLSTEYSVTIPMTYGEFRPYNLWLKSVFTEVLGDRVLFLENHMPLEDYYALLQDHPTAIYLSYRQQALGNILYLLFIGTKVYLSSHNVLVGWFKKADILVFIFETEFEPDAATNQLELNEEQIRHNQIKVRALLERVDNDMVFTAIEQAIVTQQK